MHKALPVLALVLLLLSSCDDPRIPLARGTVISFADMKLELEGRDWGRARSVVPPGEGDYDGRRFWTVHYGLGPDNEQRIVYVNDETHWAHVRSARDPALVTTNAVQAKPAAVMRQSQYPSGSFIVVLSQGQEQQIRSEVNRLNKLALENGLLPQFSTRALPNASFQLVYGWNGEHGIERLDEIGDWISLRTSYTSFYWLNLLGE